jgi:hypothetical protein
MSFNCIVSQVHIPDWDVQGNINAEQKLNLVQFGIKHLRHKNPNAFIILTGHGYRPNNSFLDLCDHVYWNSACESLNQHGYVDGMPAQFKYVSIGIEYARAKGFKRVLKTRGDSIILWDKAPFIYDGILETTRKQLLITQQTGEERMGDCFMYGDIDLLGPTWHSDNPVHNADGLQNTAINFRNTVKDHTTSWLQLLRKYCTFSDIDKMKGVCLRWNYHRLDGLNPRIQEQILNDAYDLSECYWGVANGWNVRRSGKMHLSAPYLWSEDFFNAV